MTARLDLDAYLGRIGWTGSTGANHDTLTRLLQAHMAAIPFENLDVLLGRRIRLDPEGLQAKLVLANRGGYCFEHASLFAAVLDALDYRVQRHTARVVLAAPRDVAARGHMALTVDVDGGRYMLDPGFGRQAPRVPVPVEHGVRVTHGADVHWLECDGGVWVMRTEEDGRALDCWVSPLERENLVDFEMGNWYASTHPASGFLRLLMLRATTSTGSVSVLNRDVTLRSAGAATTRRLKDRAELRALLAAHFGFDLPEVETMCVPAVPEWQ